jgi:hypothetical protein
MIKKRPEKVIGWNEQLEEQLKRGVVGVKLAYENLVRAYQAQGVEFSLNVQDALEKASNSVQISGTREVPVAKRLDLLGINAAPIIEAYRALAVACSDIAIAPDDIKENGELSEDLIAELMSSCQLKAVGQDAVDIATELELVAMAYCRFYGFMASRGQNTPSLSIIGQALNGLVAFDMSGNYKIVPHMLQQYIRRTDKQ